MVPLSPGTIKCFSKPKAFTIWLRVEDNFEHGRILFGCAAIRGSGCSVPGGLEEIILEPEKEYLASVELYSTGVELDALKPGEYFSEVMFVAELEKINVDLD